MTVAIRTKFNNDVVNVAGDFVLCGWLVRKKGPSLAGGGAKKLAC